eukprot:scaffold140942_cov30-Tisochrysis_lutea.AAC.5
MAAVRARRFLLSPLAARAARAPRHRTTAAGCAGSAEDRARTPLATRRPPLAAPWTRRSSSSGAGRRPRRAAQARPAFRCRRTRARSPVPTGPRGSGRSPLGRTPRPQNRRRGKECRDAGLCQ